jgi:DNA-binding NtrC family response regulator
MTEGRLLIIDDDPDILISTKLLLKQHFTSVRTLSNPEEITSFAEGHQVDVFLLDMNFMTGADDGKEGFYWLEKILRVDPSAVVVLMTAYGEVEMAVKAIKRGAMDFVTKPWSNDKLLATLHAGLKLSQREDEIRRLQERTGQLEADNESPYANFIGRSLPMMKVFETINKVAQTDANILILGENGTGKELVARSVHKASLRAGESFVAVDLGSIHQSLFESELFGHMKGSFTDAHTDKAGRFELADQGSIFLDEIGNLSFPLQAKLLSVLQNRKVTRIGSNQAIPVNVRLISATNMPLYEMVTKDEFRQDLLYRINTVEIRLPSLRERADDIPLLARHFLDRYKRKYHRTDLKMDNKLIKALQSYHWPGNVRELEHTIERAVILCEGKVISVNDLHLQNRNTERSNERLDLEWNEKQLILKAMKKSQGNISKAAKELGLTRAALYRRIEKHGL